MTGRTPVIRPGTDGGGSVRLRGRTVKKRIKFAVYGKAAAIAAAVPAIALVAGAGRKFG
jgi:hypothetical protein